MTGNCHKLTSVILNRISLACLALSSWSGNVGNFGDNSLVATWKYTTSEDGMDGNLIYGTNHCLGVNGMRIALEEIVLDTEIGTWEIEQWRWKADKGKVLKRADCVHPRCFRRHNGSYDEGHLKEKGDLLTKFY